MFCCAGCSDSSTFKFVLDTVCLLRFILYLPTIYSIFIYQNLLTFSYLPLLISSTWVFLSIAVVAYIYTQELSALNVSSHDLFLLTLSSLIIYTLTRNMNFLIQRWNTLWFCLFLKTALFRDTLNNTPELNLHHWFLVVNTNSDANWCSRWNIFLTI